VSPFSCQDGGAGRADSDAGAYQAGEKESKVITVTAALQSEPFMDQHWHLAQNSPVNHANNLKADAHYCMVMIILRLRISD
jgi:hypothetical protein